LGGTAGHQSDHADVNQSFAGFGEFLVVTTMAAAVCEPSERPLDDPAFGENLKARGGSPLHDRQGPADGVAEPFDQLSRIGAPSRS